MDVLETLKQHRVSTKMFSSVQMFIVISLTCCVMKEPEIPYKHTTCIPSWNDMETVVSASF